MADLLVICTNVTRLIATRQNKSFKQSDWVLTYGSLSGTSISPPLRV